MNNMTLYRRTMHLLLGRSVYPYSTFFVFFSADVDSQVHLPTSSFILEFYSMIIFS